MSVPRACGLPEASAIHAGASLSQLRFDHRKVGRAGGLTNSILISRAMLTKQLAGYLTSFEVHLRTVSRRWHRTRVDPSLETGETHVRSPNAIDLCRLARKHLYV